jgi:hypothetical protein
MDLKLLGFSEEEISSLKALTRSPQYIALKKLAHYLQMDAYKKILSFKTSDEAFRLQGSCQQAAKLTEILDHLYGDAHNVDRR